MQNYNSIRKKTFKLPSMQCTFYIFIILSFKICRFYNWKWGKLVKSFFSQFCTENCNVNSHPIISMNLDNTAAICGQDQREQNSPYLHCETVIIMLTQPSVSSCIWKRVDSSGLDGNLADNQNTGENLLDLLKNSSYAETHFA